MFDSLKTICLICLKGSVDLILGSSTAAVINHLFPYKKQSNEHLVPQVFEIFLQCSLTLLLGLEARNMIFSEEEGMSTPYGIAFMMSLFNQPGFWKKMDDLQNGLIEDLFPHSSSGK